MKRAWPIVVLIAMLAVAGLSDASPAPPPRRRRPSRRARHDRACALPHVVRRHPHVDSEPLAHGREGRDRRRQRRGVVCARRVSRHRRSRARWGSRRARGPNPTSWRWPRTTRPRPWRRPRRPQAVYRRVFGAGMDGAQIGYLGLPAHAAAAATGRRRGAVLGSLGQAVRDANGLTAAVGNSDAGVSGGQPRRARGLRRSRRWTSTGWCATATSRPTSCKTTPRCAVRRRDRPACGSSGCSAGRRVREGPPRTVARRARSRRPHASPALRESRSRRRCNARSGDRALGTLDAVVGMAEKRRGPDGSGHRRLPVALSVGGRAARRTRGRDRVRARAGAGI